MKLTYASVVVPVDGGRRGQRGASSPVVVGGGKAIVGGQCAMAGWKLVGGRYIYY